MNAQITQENSHWSTAKKIGFRFFFTYFTLFILFNNNGAYPFFNVVSGLFNRFLYQIIPWVGNNVLGIADSISVGPNGSGDTTYHFVLIFTIAVVAMLSTIIWTVADKQSRNYLKMYYWLSLGIRLYVGLMLINYGMVKVIQLQFPLPSMSRLTETFGEASPMGLAWTFLGFSKGYNIFMGLAEIAAVFLLFRRTLTFGLIITLMTTANVMAVNYFYDVPVKILSTHLFLMSAFLFARDFHKAWQFFFFRKPVSISNIYKPPFKKSFNLFLLLTKIALLVFVLVFGTLDTLRYKASLENKNNKSSLEGLYKIEELKINNKPVPLTFNSDITGWKYLMIEGKKYAQIKMGNTLKTWYQIDLDTLSKKLVLTNRLRKYDRYEFHYKEGKDDNFYLDGTIKKDSVSLWFLRTKNYREKFLLTNRGFHWINEMPYNR